MASRRTLRVARAIREIASRVIIYELADPRVGFVTVTDVDVAPDLRTATIKLTVMGDENQSRLCLRAVQGARGRIQHEVADALRTKTVPRLEFQLDDSVKKSVELSRLINLAVSEYRTPPDSPVDDVHEPPTEEEP